MVKKQNVYFKRCNSKREQQNKVKGVFEGSEATQAPLPPSSPTYLFLLPFFFSEIHYKEVNYSVKGQLTPCNLLQNRCPGTKFSTAVRGAKKGCF